MNTEHQKGLLLSCTLPYQRTEYEIDQVHIPAVENIITLVCVRLNIYRGYLFEKGRQPKRIYAKQILMYALKKQENLSCDKIGEILDCGRANVIHGIRQVEGFVKFYEETRRDVEAIFNLLNPGEAVKLAS